MKFLRHSPHFIFAIFPALFAALLTASCSVSSQTQSSSPAKPAAPAVQFLRAWGKKGSDPGQLARPAAIAADSLGDVYIVDAGLPTPFIDKFTHDGHPLMSFTPAGPLLDPCGITVDSGGAIYAFECRSGSLSIFFPNGDFLRRISGAFRTIHANPPSGVAVDGDGHIYLAQENPSHFARFTSLGAPLPAMPFSDPKSQTPLANISSIAAGPDGDIYAADASQHRIARISPDAALVNTWQWTSTPASAPASGSSSAAGDLTLIGASEKYVALLTGQNSAPMLHVWTLEGAEKFAGPLPEGGSASPSISAVAVAPNGEIYLLDRAASRIFCYKINL